MPLSARVRCILGVWLVLMAGTAASTWGFSRPAVVPMASTLAIMAVAAIKALLVMRDFMELKYAPPAWRLAGTAWMLAVVCVVAILYLI